MMIKQVYMRNTSIAGWHMSSRKLCRTSGATKLLETPVFIGKLHVQEDCVRIRMGQTKQDPQCQKEYTELLYHLIFR